MGLFKGLVKGFNEGFNMTFKPEEVNKSINEVRKTLGKEPVETFKETKDKNKDNKYNFNF